MDIFLPDYLDGALKDGAPLVVSVSGGKDSDAAAKRLATVRQERRWQGEFILLHADLGRAEWSFSLPHCEVLARNLGAEFVVVRRDHDLFEGFERRWKKLVAEGKKTPPFPSPKNRYCTSDWKTAECNKWIRNRFDDATAVVSAWGLRAEESSKRAKRLPCETNKKASALVQKNRQVWNWQPIHKWKLADVWHEIGLTLDELAAYQAAWEAAWKERDSATQTALMAEFPAHPAYLFGNERVSCVECILASEHDLRNGARYQPRAAAAIIDLEHRSGFTFLHEKSLEEIVASESTSE